MPTKASAQRKRTLLFVPKEAAFPYTFQCQMPPSDGS